MSQKISGMELLGGEYDGTPVPDAAPRAVVVCTLPRSGSNRLCQCLLELGYGVPGEYFQPYAADLMMGRWGMATNRSEPGWERAYWAEIRRRRLRNGFVGLTVFGFQIPTLKAILEPRDRPVFLHLRRRNVSDQVASLLGVYQTKMPYDDPIAAPTIPDLSNVSEERAIRTLHRWMTVQEGRWRRYLADKPDRIEIDSDAFFASPRGVLQEILGKTGHDVTPDLVERVAQQVEATPAYSPNAAIKQDLLERYRHVFEELDR